MVRRVLITLLFCFPLLALAQSWPYDNAQWHYDWNGVGLWGRYNMSIGTDTIIDGVTWCPLIQEGIEQQDGGPDGSIVTFYEPEYLRALLRVEDSRYWRLHEEGELLLYDFDAEVGDSWLIEIREVFDCPIDSHYVEVTEVGTVPVNGQERRYIDLALTDEAIFGIEGRVVEGIGPINGTANALFPDFHFPYVCSYLWEGPTTDLSCYSDSQVMYPESGADCRPIDSWVANAGRWCFYKGQGLWGSYGGCECWAYTQDSMVNDQVYQVIEGHWYAEAYPYSGTNQTFTQDNILLRTDGDAHYSLYNEVEQMIVDFSASPGDSWEVTPIMTSTGFQGPLLTLTVDSIYTDTYGETTRRTMAVSTLVEHPDVEDCQEILPGTIVEGLYFSLDGSSEYLVPHWPDNVCTLDGNDLLYFSAHESPSSGTYQETLPVLADCADFLSVSSIERVLPLSLFPNPSSGLVTLQWPQGLKAGMLTIIDSGGRLIERSHHSAPESVVIDLKDHAPGLYQLILMAEESQWSGRLLISR